MTVIASDKSFVDYVTEQLAGAGSIHAKRMFGEYGLFCDGLFFAAICDNQFFVKITPAGKSSFPSLPKRPPYEGAKEYFLVEDVDDREQMTVLTRLTCESLRALPKKEEE